MVKGSRILGIDPGSRVAGWAVIESVSIKPFLPRDFKVINLGTIVTSEATETAKGLGYLHNCFFEMITTYSPSYIAIEKAFVGINIKSALRLGESRGAILAAAERHDIKIFELAATQIKQTIAGSGRAEKIAVKKSLELLFGKFDKTLVLDATDALACALTLAINSDSGSIEKPNQKKNSSLRSIGQNYIAKNIHKITVKII